MEDLKEQLKQALLERYTPDMYRNITAASVAIAGLGGLGSNVAVMLARAGVSKLLLADCDSVEITNLNRQAYDCSHLGQSKPRALSTILRNINPYLKLDLAEVRVTQENAAELFKAYPIVCEAFDVPEQKAMLVNTVLETCKNTVIISGSGMAGYGSGNSVITSRPMERLYLCGDGTTELSQTTCLMSSRVAICAAHQAHMIIRLILGIKEV